MTKDTKHNFKNATGKIDYTLMNDYMFHRVMEENEPVLKGLVCALLHLQSKKVHSITVMNPIEQGSAVDAKTFILDLKILLNNNVIINIELQVESLTYWDDRSSAYFVRTIDALKKGDTYASLKPVYHIGILNFTPFPDYPEFFATNKFMNGNSSALK